MHQAQVRRGETGYAMVALLVVMALMAVMMSVAMPVWRQAAQREKEAELIWRGQQYDRALQLFRRKAGAPGAPNLDILIQQRFLRKKYKDPITGGDFELRPVSAMGTGTQMPGMPGMGNRGQGAGNRSPAFGGQTTSRTGQPGGPSQGRSVASEPEGSSGSSPFGNQPSGRGELGQGAGQAGPGGQRGPGQLIGGVRSKSKAKSIRELNGRTRYDQWEFVYVPYNPNPQPPGVAGTAPGQRTPGQRSGGSRSPGTAPTGSSRPGAGGPVIQ